MERMTAGMFGWLVLAAAAGIAGFALLISMFALILAWAVRPRRGG